MVKNKLFLGMFLASSLINLKANKGTGKNSKNKLNLPDFKGAIEVKSSAAGRLRFYIPSIVENVESIKEFLKTIKKIGEITKCEVNVTTGVMLIEYDIEKVDAMTIEGLVIKLLRIDATLDKGRKSLVSEKAKLGKEAVSNGIYEFTNGIFDTKSLLASIFILLAANDIRKSGFTKSPGFATLLWWTDHLI